MCLNYMSMCKCTTDLKETLCKTLKCITFICTGCLLNTERPKCKHTDKVRSKPCKRTQVKTDITHQYFGRWCQTSGWDTEFGSSSRFHPHLCQEEEKAMSFLLGTFLQDSVISLRLSPPQPCPSPSPGLSPPPQPHSQIQAHSFQPQSEPQARLVCHRLGPGLVRPETMGGHEAVCKAPAKPVYWLTSLWMRNVSKQTNSTSDACK